MMELGATVCLPRNPTCLICPLEKFCKTHGEHPTVPRAKMLTKDVSHALVLRMGGQGSEVLLEQRSPAQTVMPGMWELPHLINTEIPEAELLVTVRHAIMQVNYTVGVRSVASEQANALTKPAENRSWIPLQNLNSLALTGLARKVLIHARLMSRSTKPQ